MDASLTADHMRRSFLTLTIALSLLVRAPLHADDLVFGRFSDLLDSLRLQAGIPGLSASIVGSTAVLWEHAYGQQDAQQAIAARPDTPFELDGTTQTFTAELVLRCVEEGRLNLDTRIGAYDLDAPEPDATLRQLLSHTNAAGVFSYQPDRLAPLTYAVRACRDGSFRKTVSSLLDQLAMIDSVPGLDAPTLRPPAEGIPTTTQAARYSLSLTRLAVPYAVDASGRATASQYTTTSLTPSSGLISTTRDLAQFDLALKSGVLLQSGTLAAAWKAPIDAGGHAQPHGLGWFVQQYNGEQIVWQFGVSSSGSSSLMLTVPGRSATLILLANSSGLSQPFGLSAGDVTASPFAKLFLGTFVR